MSERKHWYGPPSKASRKAWTAYIARLTPILCEYADAVHTQSGFRAVINLAVSCNLRPAELPARAAAAMLAAS